MALHTGISESSHRMPEFKATLHAVLHTGVSESWHCIPEFKATLHAVQGDYFYCVWFDLRMMLLICHCPWPRTRGTHAAQLHSTSHQAQHPLLQKWAWRENHCFCLSRVSLPLLTYKFSKAYPFISVAQSCPTLCGPMYHSTSGLPVHHQLLEFTHIPVHWVGDAIQPSHPLSSTSLPALNLSQH